MDDLTAACVPVCGQIGHTIVSAYVCRCDHHGALTGHVVTYQELPEAPATRTATEWVGGPFTAGDDVEELIGRISKHLRDLLT